MMKEWPVNMTDPVMTVEEIAIELRCSKGHVYHLINGTVRGVTPLPCLQLGRRKLVRRSRLEAWKDENDRARMTAEQHDPSRMNERDVHA
jgi:excisionase family DNA binding protein